MISPSAAAIQAVGRSQTDSNSSKQNERQPQDACMMTRGHAQVKQISTDEMGKVPKSLKSTGQFSKHIIQTNFKTIIWDICELYKNKIWQRPQMPTGGDNP